MSGSTSSSSTPAWTTKKQDILSSRLRKPYKSIHNKHEIISSSNQKTTISTNNRLKNINQTKNTKKSIKTYNSDFMNRLLNNKNISSHTKPNTRRNISSYTYNSSSNSSSISKSISKSSSMISKYSFQPSTHPSSINNDISMNSIKSQKRSQKRFPKSLSKYTSEYTHDLSLIRSNDRIVLYSIIAHSYICLNDTCEQKDVNSEQKPMLLRNVSKNDDEIKIKENMLFLKCEDMEGIPLMIGETQFRGTICKFSTDCKIQLCTGQCLAKHRQNVIVSKHATKFMLQRISDLQSASSMRIGHKVHIFIEASRSNHKQYWSYDRNTACIVLKECVPGKCETFILQKYGQPLVVDGQCEIRNGDGFVVDKFFSQASIHVQEYYMMGDILRVLSVKFVFILCVCLREHFDGDFITFTYDSVYGFPKAILKQKYSLQKIVSSAVKLLLPLIQNTAHIRHFLNIHRKSQYGIISQALCSEVDVHMNDFNLLLVQLETKLTLNELTLQNMHFYLKRATRTISALQVICYTIHVNQQKYMPSSYVSSVFLSSQSSSMIMDDNNDCKRSANKSMSICMGCKGGALLNILQQQMDTNGEKNVRILYAKLIKACCIPYFHMLGNWIYHGIIHDIYGEFMIQEKTHLKKENVNEEYNDEYWTGRYSLNRMQIPSILFEYKDIIVTTGKYLNVMRESNYAIQDNTHNSTDSKIDVLLKCHTKQLGKYINNAYNFASKTLLEMLMNREQIMKRFSSIKRYMLISECDWFNTFIDISYNMLYMNASEIKISKLNSLLELSFRISMSSKNDPFKDDVQCDIKSKNLQQMICKLYDMRQEYGSDEHNRSLVGKYNKEVRDSKQLMSLTGIQAFALDYKVQWPASIIFTGRNVIRYQLIFRFLLKLKMVSRQLQKAWQQQMSLRELNLYHAHNISLILRHSMIAFMNNLLFYISYEVIEPNYNIFMMNVRQISTTVDAVLNSQNLFLRSTLEKCLLTDKLKIELLFEILALCESYANFVQRYTSDCKIFDAVQVNGKSREQRKMMLSVLENDCRNNLLEKDFLNTVEKYSKGFQRGVRKFLYELQNSTTVNMNVLLSRLDFNSYYIYQNYRF